MSWPTPQDYNEAIQSPSLCFSDAELRAGQPALTSLGLPQPFSGAFATVYRMNCGSKVWAVRCFARDFADQQQRYHAISNCLESLRLPFIVGFEFLQQGILVRGQWYPILKMEWVDGDLLNTYIEKNLRQPHTLYLLARQWIDVMSKMRESGIAHGDLQHGNILISPSGITLIDYDGMFVPSLSGFQSHEEGHRNYQHPSRTGKDFGPHIDTFSGWVILASISALMVEPRLWTLLNGGDECLLFRREDFTSPGNSRAFQAIANSHSPELRALVNMLRSFVPLRMSQIPAVDGRTSPASPQASVTTRRPDWIDHATRSPAIEPLPAVASTITKDSSHMGALWLIDHIVEPAPLVSVWKGATFTIERLSIVVSITAMFIMAILGIAMVIPLWLSTIACAALTAMLGWVFYSRYGEVVIRSKRSHFSEAVAMARRRIVDIEAQQSSIMAALRELDLPLLTIREQYEALPNRFQVLQHQARNKSDSTLQDIIRREQQCDDTEKRELLNAQNRLRSELSQTLGALSSLDSEQRNEIALATKHNRERHIADYMRNTSIAHATLTGIGPKLKATLQMAGYNNAFDVFNRGVQNVSGIGEKKRSILLWWAEQAKRNAESSVPTSPSSVVLDQIASKYRARRQQLESRGTQLKSQQSDVQRSILARFAQVRTSLAEEKRAAERQAASDQESVKLWFEREKARLTADFKSCEARNKEKRRELETGRRDCQQPLFEARIQLCAAERQAARFRSLSVRHYLAHVLFLRSPE